MTDTRVRLAELIASLSLATDLGLGQPQEHVLRQTVIATRLARAAGLSEEQQAAGFYVSLLAWVGCVADSHELAHWFGDDRQVRSDSYQVDKAGLPMLRFLLGHVASGGTALQRITMIGRFLTGGIHDATDSFVTHCQTTGDIADRLQLQPDVRLALGQAFERWDGQGVPNGLKGDQIDPVIRVVHVADDAEAFWRIGGTADAVGMLQSRRGTEFDPALVDLCTEQPDEIFGGLDTTDAWSAVIDGCSALDRRLDDSELTGVLQILADYADLKSPWFTGHSRSLATLARAAAEGAGLDAGDADLVERAALVSRLGTIGVSSGIWDKAGPLSTADRERVRTVPYLTERVLCRQPTLATIGGLAGMCHERMDGSGYPRGLSGGSIPLPARLLAAAEVYRAMSEARPYRDALSRGEREAALRAEAGAGRLDARAVDAVLAAAGHQRRARPTNVAGLTAREIEVLDLLVRGSSNKQIATRLSITPRTAGSHIEHIYTKIGVSTRGAAAMFAMRHGLVADPEKIG